MTVRYIIGLNYSPDSDVQSVNAMREDCRNTIKRDCPHIATGETAIFESPPVRTEITDNGKPTGVIVNREELIAECNFCEADEES